MSDYKVKKTEAEWKEQSDPMQRQVARRAAIERVVDMSHGMVRVEVPSLACAPTGSR